MKKMVFITKYGITKDLDGKLSSRGASARLRLLPCAKAGLNFNDIKIEIMSIPDSINTTQINYLKKFDVIFISKITDKKTLEFLSSLSNTNKLIISDFCDNRFEESELSIYYKTIANNSHIITVNTTSMLEVLNSVAPTREKIVISDPVENNKILCRSNSYYQKIFDSKILHILWFSHQDGIKNLINNYPDLKQATAQNNMQSTITALTGLNSEVINFFESFNNQKNNMIPVHYHTWSIELMIKFQPTLDLSYIPMPINAFNKTKSPNRLLQSLWFGLPTIASPLDSYKEFQEFSYLDSDISNSLNRFINDSNIEGKVSSAQELIEQNYSQSAITNKWASILRKM